MFSLLNLSLQDNRLTDMSRGVCLVYNTAKLTATSRQPEVTNSS